MSGTEFLISIIFVRASKNVFEVFISELLANNLEISLGYSHLIFKLFHCIGGTKLGNMANCTIRGNFSNFESLCEGILNHSAVLPAILRIN